MSLSSRFNNPRTRQDNRHHATVAPRSIDTMRAVASNQIVRQLKYPLIN